MYCVGIADEDEYDYVGILNRALPEDIRVLGWCPVPPGFNARYFDLNLSTVLSTDILAMSEYSNQDSSLF